jgi:hypothetical protein
MREFNDNDCREGNVNAALTPSIKYRKMDKDKNEGDIGCVALRGL